MSASGQHDLKSDDQFHWSCACGSTVNMHKVNVPGRGELWTSDDQLLGLIESGLRVAPELAASIRRRAAGGQ